MKSVVISPPFQTSFKIKTNCEELVRLLKLKHGKYLTTCCRNGAKSIMAVRKEDGVYDIAFSNKVVQDKSGAVAIDEIIFNNTQFDPNIFAIHGAAVEWQGRACLFLASTTSGKSTLTSYLTNKGFGYITDDCILLDRTSYKIYPYPAPIHLRDGGLDVLKRCHAEPYSFEIMDDQSLRRYVYTPSNCVDVPVTLDKIFFINRTDDENRVLPMDTNSRIMALMKSPITPYPVTSAYLAFLSRLSSQDCFTLNYCDMDFVAEVIQNG